MKTLEQEPDQLLYLPRHEISMAQLIREAKNLDDALKLMIGFVNNIREGLNKRHQEHLDALKQSKPIAWMQTFTEECQGVRKTKHTANIKRIGINDIPLAFHPLADVATIPTVQDDQANHIQNEGVDQNWMGMDGATAHQLIFRHADGWSDAGRMMHAWLNANAPDPDAEVAPEELAALIRFHETCEDGEDYDVPKEMMRRLALIGLVCHTSRGLYTTTFFGDWVMMRAAAKALLRCA